MPCLTWLSKPWVDKSIAVIAIVPFVYVLYEYLAADTVPIPGIVLMIHVASVIATMLMRTPPRRVTSNALYWLLAFVATYWGFLTVAIYESGTQLAPLWVVYSIDVVSLCVLLWARFSLGRNIGFVPAERSIVTTGAYAFVRHPIYTGIFLSIVALELSSFTWRNLALDAMWIALFVVKTFIEERFLSQNADYVDYVHRVKWRWLPGVA